MASPLADLPDDIVYILFASLENARDLWALGLSCRRFHHLIDNNAWRIFVKNRFPTLNIPDAAKKSHTWQQLAESMTWQSRGWDKRSLQYHALLPHLEPRRHGGPHAAQRGMFMAVVAARFDPDSQEELVAWGAGEDIIARYRGRQGRGKASEISWQKVYGRDLGLRVGYDDVTAIKIVKHANRRAIITGRHNGELSLLSAEQEDFGKRIVKFGSVVDPETGARKLGQDTINSLDILDNGSTTLLAAGARSCVRIYSQLEEGDVDVAPVTVYDLKDSVLDSKWARLSNARWMENGDTLALGLVGCKDGLRYLSITPDGWTHHVAAKSERVAKEFSIKYDRTICPNSMEPVHLHSGAGSGTSLLLSSWRDGTIRLQDLRTPSPFDAIYQDNVDPWSNAEALMSYGTERFIAGGGGGLTIQVFDFRWTKDYYHTSALPCLDRSPFPRPHQPFLKEIESARRARCDHAKNLPCTWHGLSNSLYYRPNAKYFLSESLRSFRTTTVWSLARASDITPNFYVGISGGVIEANLEETPPTYPPQPGSTVDPHFGFADWRASAPHESSYKTKALVPALMETGDGYSFKGNDRSILLPGLVQYQGPREGGTGRQRALAKHHRLDAGYHQEVDFADCLN